MKLLVGLGNIGEKYTNTRHNIGFVVIDELAIRLSASAFHDELKFKSSVAEADFNGEKLILLKPTTMMNDSGKAVGAIASFYKIAPDNIWIIHDDVDLPLGTVRIRTGGSSSHNGVGSVINSIGTNFVRVRLGIGSNKDINQPSEKYVLDVFSADQDYARKVGIERAIDLVLASLKTGIIPTTQS